MGLFSGNITAISKGLGYFFAPVDRQVITQHESRAACEEASQFVGCHTRAWSSISVVVAFDLQH